MTTETFDARDALDAYYGDRTAQRPARLWSVEKLVLVLAEAGFITLFKGGGSNPTVLTGYASSKLWLRVDSGVTSAPGTIRGYDGAGDVTQLAAWPVLDLAGLRRHLSVYSRAEVDAAISAGLPPGFDTDNVPNASSVSGTTATDALNALKTLIDTANTNIGTNTSSIATLTSGKVNTSVLGQNNGVATLDSGGKLTASQIPASITSPFQFQGTWNASTNTPTLTSGVGTAGHLYRVSVAGATTLDGQSGWQVGDEVYFGGGVWNRLGTATPATISKIGKPVGFAGGNTRAFVTSNNELFAVGDHTNSQNGFSTALTTLPVMVPFNVAPSTISRVVVGPRSTYVLDTTGKVWSYGGNANGQLGHGDTTARQIATRIEFFVSNSLTVTDIVPACDAGGSSQECVFFITSTGALYACGNNASGQLGLGDTTQRTTPVLVSAVSNVAKVVVGGNNNVHAFAITASGALWATGYNGAGQLGLGDTTNRTTFTVVTGFTNAADGAASGYATGATASGSSYIIKTDGTLWVAGYNGWGQLGLGDTTNRSAFVQVPSIAVTKVACSPDSSGSSVGANVACVTTSGNLICCGSNHAGQLGDGTTTLRSSFITPSGSFQGTVTEVACAGNGASGNYAIYARTSGGQIWAAGFSSNGNLGTNSTAATSTAFVQTVGLTGTLSDWAVVGSAGTFGVTVLFTDGRVGICGAGASGQLALGVAANSAIFRTIGAQRMGQ